MSFKTDKEEANAKHLVCEACYNLIGYRHPDNYEQALQWMLSQLKSNHGFGDPVDEELGFSLLEEAAVNGDSNAMYIIGYGYEWWKKGKCGDVENALYWYNQGIEKGNVMCLTAAGSLLLKSKSESDMARAEPLLKKANELGDLDAGLILGSHLSTITSRRIEGARILAQNTLKNHIYSSFRLNRICLFNLHEFHNRYYSLCLLYRVIG